jgi:DNA-directed RNA polymerase specialized sigma24 family protein
MPGAKVDPDGAGDILQEPFIKIWHNLNEFDAGLKLSSWKYDAIISTRINSLELQQMKQSPVVME